MTVKLVPSKNGLQLHWQDSAKPNAKPTIIEVDFISGAMAHRRQYGGGKGQLIAKAVGLSRVKNPVVFDVTAGLGRDAFVLACLGCRVTMIERAPVLVEMLQTALKCAAEEPWFAELSLTLLAGDAKTILPTLTEKPDVVYLDPMFPDSRKSALVKKEMQVLQALLGEDDNGEELLGLSRQVALMRVVVKRPKGAPFLANEKPDQQYMGKSTRFDVYFCHHNQAKR